MVICKGVSTYSFTSVHSLEIGYAEKQPMWPHWVGLRNYSEAAWMDMNAWMIDTFGNSNWGTPSGRSVGSNGKYRVREESDRTFFILRWS